MINDLEKKIICSVIDGNNGITSIVKNIYGDTNLKNDYERVKYHIKNLTSKGIITKNENGYKLPDDATIGDATVELNTGEVIEVLEAGKTIFMRGTTDGIEAIAMIFLETADKKKTS